MAYSLSLIHNSVAMQQTSTLLTSNASQIFRTKSPGSNTFSLSFSLPARTQGLPPPFPRLHPSKEAMLTPPRYGPSLLLTFTHHSYSSQEIEVERYYSIETVRSTVAQKFFIPKDAVLLYLNGFHLAEDHWTVEDYGIRSGDEIEIEEKRRRLRRR